MKLEESYSLFKKLYKESGASGIMLRETPASFLTYTKNYLQKVLNREPNANNYPILAEDKAFYWERIAGFYNTITKEFIFIEPQEIHQDEEVKYSEGYVRFFISDFHHRTLYVSHFDYDVAYKGYKALKKHYADMNIEYFVVEYYNFEADDWKEVTFDASGKKSNITYIYESFMKYILPLFGGRKCEYF
jgi:hypothetical protein